VNELQPQGASYVPESTQLVWPIGRQLGQGMAYKNTQAGSAIVRHPTKHFKVQQEEDRTFVNMQLQVRLLRVLLVFITRLTSADEIHDRRTVSSHADIGARPASNLHDQPTFTPMSDC
jgi:hypothetical protein